MRQTEVLEAWVEQKSAAADGLQSIGPTLYVDDRPVACWLDRADETGAQIALYALRMGRPWLLSNIEEAVYCVRGTSLRVPCPLSSPTLVQQSENINHLVGAWRQSIAATARSTRYAWGNYQLSKRQGAQAKLYAWAFDLPEPKLNVSREELSRARRNAGTSRREGSASAFGPPRDFLRALWRSGRDLPHVFLGPVMVRLSSDRQTIETSEGEKVAISNVPVALLWGLACECRQQKRSLIWRIVSERPRIGRWSAQMVCADGSVQVGCHSVSFEEIARLAVTLNLK
jgi:hypothetical protein